MDFSNVFSVFSKRRSLPKEKTIALTSEFRNRVYLLWIRTFARASSSVWPVNESPLWSDVYDRLLYSLGRNRLSIRHALTRDKDLDNFLGECNDEYFLKFVEFSFQSEAVFLGDASVGDLIVAVNQFFQEDDPPFFLTEFTVSQRNEAVKLEAYPQIIRRDSEILHHTAIEPALMLLRGTAFTEANKEYLNALEDYRKGEFGDCVTKCGSALESVMKVISEHKGWPKKNTSKQMLDVVWGRTNLPTFLKEPLMQTAVIRNKLSTAHGAGTKPRDVEEHIAQYTINVTASAILLLVRESNP